MANGIEGLIVSLKEKKIRLSKNLEEHFLLQLKTSSPNTVPTILGFWFLLPGQTENKNFLGYSGTS